nr:MAG TPA: active helicase ring shaped helicase [Caudoviricetes sp.]
MEPLDRLDKKSILDEKIFLEIFDQENEIEKARMIIALTDRAIELNVKGKFEELLKAYKRVDRATKQKESKKPTTMLDKWTNFTGPYANMFCGAWIAGEDGVYAQNDSQVEAVACYHPILPIERMKNMETGEEQIKIAYKRNGRWDEIIVPKTMVTSASKIVALSGRGISVTSENAKLLVRYLSDVENMNDDHIKVQYSTSKLGWIGEQFIPYDTEIVFDGDSRFHQAYDSVAERGRWEIWRDHMLKLRKTGRVEVKFMMAASFASVLVSLLGGLPFIVDLWGETEGGKTVSLMVAASIWANPDESAYIGDFKTTEVALEAKADMLNHLPMLLDDTSKTSSRIRDNFEGIVYDMCSGKGKSRSNKDLGINRENRWKNCFLTNGERPLNSYVSQGGAINRILEVECGESVYEDPQETAELVKKNYGLAGKRYIATLKALGVEKIRQIQKEFQLGLHDDEAMQKQSMSLAILLTADKIATDSLFKDGQYITLEEAKTVLINRNDLSDNERCYRYLQDKIAMNNQRFDIDTKVEKWGILENGYAIIYNQAFKELCKSGGFSDKAFLSWADRKGLIETQGGRLNKVKKIDGNPVRCVFLKLNDDIDKDGFESAETYDQEELPFK